MKIKFIFLAIIIILVSCTKESSNGTAQSGGVTMLTGIYEGTYNDFLHDTTIYKFQVQVSKIDSLHYQVSKITSGGIMPTFIMTDKIHQAPVFIDFIISTQLDGTKPFSGNGGVSIGYDGLFDSDTKSLYFGFAYNNIQFSTIEFNGYKN